MELPEWEFAFQSASTTGEPWLGPDLLSAIERSGAKDVLVCPIGFVADHLEILYDLDVEAQQFARDRGIEIQRTASFNDRPEFIRALASVTADAMKEAGWTTSTPASGSQVGAIIPAN
jgi:ferrochelatase